MLKVNQLNKALTKENQSTWNAGLDFESYWSALRQHWPMIAISTALFLFIGICYVLLSPSKFTASATILIDTRKNQLLSSAQQVVGDQVLDTTGVDSQVEILKSESIALQVIHDLKLADDPVFKGSPGLIKRITTIFLSDDNDAPSEATREQAIVESFGRNLIVKRVGLTYAIDIGYTTSSPVLSASIANAIADAYSVSELESRYQATKRASKWLQDRIQELREQATNAEVQVQKFRSENNIIDTGRGLLTEQQLSDVNGQLITARAATAEAKARLERISEIGKDGVPNTTVTDALRNDIITRLRAQYLDLSARQSDWSKRFGELHPSVQNLNRQMAEIRKSILDELGRIAETYKSEYEIARTREQSLQESLATLVEGAGATGQAQVKLRDLSSSAQTYRNLYDTFLQRFMEATQQQTFPVSEARIISSATPPRNKSAPRTSIILPAATVLGLIFGAVAALARERLSTSVFRTSADIERETNVECLGILPRIAPSKGTTLLNPSGSLLNDPMARLAIDAPFSRFAETIRAVKVASDIRGMIRKSQVIGIVSALPNEGKTTITANIAATIAASGRRVLVIDGDLRNPSLTRLLAPHVSKGLMEVLSGDCSVIDVAENDGETGFVLVPVAANERVWQTAELLSSEAMAKILEAARKHYEYVIIDLPPILPVVDVRAVSHMIDSFILIVEWNKTSRAALREALQAVEHLADRLIGTILNKATSSQLQRLEYYKGRTYNQYYRKGIDVS